QQGRIEFAFATDDSVHLPLLPTPPRGDAVTVGYKAGVGLPEEGLHLLGQNALASALGATLVAARLCTTCGNRGRPYIYAGMRPPFLRTRFKRTVDGPV